MITISQVIIMGVMFLQTFFGYRLLEAYQQKMCDIIITERFNTYIVTIIVTLVTYFAVFVGFGHISEFLAYLSVTAIYSIYLAFSARRANNV